VNSDSHCQPYLFVRSEVKLLAKNCTGWSFDRYRFENKMTEIEPEAVTGIPDYEQAECGLLC
jgi:hypothetical protein